MIIRNAAFAQLVKQVQNQEREIKKLDEKLALLAHFLGQQFDFNVGEGLKLSEIPPELKKFIETKRKNAHSLDASS